MQRIVLLDMYSGRQEIMNKLTREEKEMKEAIKRLKDKRLRGSRDLSSSSLFRLIAMIETLEWVLGDKRVYQIFSDDCLLELDKDHYILHWRLGK